MHLADFQLLARVKALEGDPPDAVVVFSRVFEEFGKEGPFGVGYDLALARWVARHYTVVSRSAGGAVHRRTPVETAARVSIP